MSNYKYKVGDKVLINPNSPYCGQTMYRGEITSGTISSLISDRESGDYQYYVRWGNGNSNSYRDIDLLPSKEEEIEYDIY